LSDGSAPDRRSLDPIAATYASAHGLEVNGSTSIASLAGKYYDLRPVELRYAVHRSGRRIPVVDYSETIGVFVADGGSCASFTVEEVLYAYGDILGTGCSAEQAIAEMVYSSTGPRAWGTYAVCDMCGWQQRVAVATPPRESCPRCGGQLELRHEGPLASGPDAA
jgi:hypothetical protein